MKDHKVSYKVLQLELAELIPVQLPVVTGHSWVCSHNSAGDVSSHLSTLCTGLPFPLIAVVLRNPAHLIVQGCKFLPIDPVLLISVALNFEIFLVVYRLPKFGARSNLPALACLLMKFCGQQSPAIYANTEHALLTLSFC